MDVVRPDHRIAGLTRVAIARAPRDVANLSRGTFLVNLRNVAVLGYSVAIVLLLMRVHDLLVVLLTLIVQLVDGPFFVPLRSEAMGGHRWFWRLSTHHVH